LKPIAFLALFRHHSNLSTVFFVDADVYLNAYAFESLARHEQQQQQPQTYAQLDDMFELSPQASLLGSQNPSGKDWNILLNGGFLGLRNDEWIRDFSALWWYCRCGVRDQNSLWLVLFAQWSAMSNEMKSFLESLEATTYNNDGDNRLETIQTFSYPGMMFDHYEFARAGVMPYSRQFLPKLQALWKSYWSVVPKTSKTAKATISTSSMSVPTNVDLFNGGYNDFLNATSDKYLYPMELPHVLLLPLNSFEYKGKIFPELITKVLSNHNFGSTVANTTAKTTQSEKRTIPILFSHSREPTDVCKDHKCWPFK